MITLKLTVERRSALWEQAEDGWDCFIDGEEQYDLGALTFNGVVTHMAKLIDNPNAIVPEPDHQQGAQWNRYANTHMPDVGP